MMANEFTINPLGGLDVGAGIAGLGQQFGQQMRADEAMKEAQSQEMKTQDLMRKAYSGDPDAMREIFVQNQDVGIKLKEMDEERKIKLGVERKKVVDQANFNYAKAIKFAKTPEEKQQVIDRAIEDPNSDLYDQDDIGKPAEELDFDSNMLLYSRLGDKGYKALGFGMQEPEAEIKTSVLQTPTGATVINEQTGEVIKTITDPAKKAEYNAKQKERKQSLARRQAEEKRKIEKFKSSERTQKDARVSAVDGASNAITIINELLSGDSIEDVTGVFDRVGAKLGVQTGTEEDTISKALQLQNLLTIENLGLMQGPLTNTDIQILANAASGLRIDEEGFIGSTKGVKKQIEKIKSDLLKGLEKSVARGDLSQMDYENIINPKQEESGFSSLWGD